MGARCEPRGRLPARSAIVAEQQHLDALGRNAVIVQRLDLIQFILFQLVLLQFIVVQFIVVFLVRRFPADLPHAGPGRRVGGAAAAGQRGQ